MSTLPAGIFIEAHEVTYAGMSTGALHLYLVYRDTTGEEYVIRSGPQYPAFPLIGDMKIETNVRMEASADKRVADTSTLEARYSTPLDFGTLSDDAAWALMVKYARMIDAANTPYELFEENSNAFVGALLEAALDAGGLDGLDPEHLLPSTISPLDAVGLSYFDDLMARVAQPLDGVVWGTGGADVINGIQVAEVIRAGGGNDTVSAGRGADEVWGGAGDDRLSGGQGDDRLHGQAGQDTLTGGADRDLMWAGADLSRDVFVFAAATDSAVGEGRDVIHEFRAPTSRKDAAADVIDLRGIDADTGLAATGDQAFRFGGTTAAKNAAWFETVAGAAGGTDVILSGDVNGDALADFQIRIAGVSGLGANALLL